MVRADTSIVIPAFGVSEESDKVLSGILGQSLLPSEVIVVRSGLVRDAVSFWDSWIERFKSFGISCILVRVSNTLFPGAARNLGLQYVTKQWVAFLDVETIPCEHWLGEQTKRIGATNAMGSFGSTVYAARSVKQAIVRDAVYGRRPIQTLPGSVLRKDLFSLVGQFIPNTRAAEDTEWMIRAKAMGVKLTDSPNEALISYNGLTKIGLRGLVKKWRRNYLSSRQLQHLKVQTTIVWLIGYVVVSLTAFNWNAIVAGWQVDSSFYLDHITKIVSLTPIVLYVVFRGCYLPFKRGVPLGDILPLRFLLLAAVGALLDSVKVATIFFPKERRVGTSERAE